MVVVISNCGSDCITTNCKKITMDVVRVVFLVATELTSQARLVPAMVSIPIVADSGMLTSASFSPTTALTTPNFGALETSFLVSCPNSCTANEALRRSDEISDGDFRPQLAWVVPIGIIHLWMPPTLSTRADVVAQNFIPMVETAQQLGMEE